MTKAAPLYLDTVVDGLMTVVAPAVESAFPRSTTELAAAVLARVRADLTDPVDHALETKTASGIQAAASDVASPAFRDLARAAIGRVRDREARFKAPAATAGGGQSGSLEDRLFAYLAERTKGTGRTVTKVSMVPGGRSKLTAFADFAEADGAKSQIVIRLDVPEARIRTTVAEEFPLLKHAFEQGCPVAEPLWLETDPAHGAPFMASVRMSGKMAAQHLFDFEHVTPELAHGLAKILAKIHSLDPAVVWPKTAGMDAQACTLAMLDEFDARFRETSDMRPSPVLETAFALLRDGARHLTGPAAVVHADAGFHNVLIDADGGVQCLLDWEFSHPGAPEEDMMFARRAAEKVIPAEDFMRTYLDAGGRPPNEAAMRVLPLWTDVRNLVFGANMSDAFLKGEIKSVQAAAVCLNTYNRLENELAGKLLTFL